MRHRAWLWLVLSSLAGSLLFGATRPHYGGTLNVDVSTSFSSLEASELPPILSRLIGETLVRFNSRGEPEPLLATSWQRENDGKRWRIALRPKVSFHDGDALSAGNAAPVLLESLKKTYPDVTVSAGGQTLLIQSDVPLPDLLTDLASARTAIVRKNDAGLPIGTGPFRVTAWEPGRRLALAAFEPYWGGRPFLDSIVVAAGSSRATTDLFDIPFASPRRAIPETVKLWQSAPVDLLALVATDLHPSIYQALALVIDRTPIVNVLAQRRAEAAYGLLPQWMGGYEFLFQIAPDLARARQVLSQLAPSPLALSYPPNDSFARAVAERIALNARDVGLILQPTSNPNGTLRLIRSRLESTNAAAELARLARLLGANTGSSPLDTAKPETLFAAEHELLENNRVIPLLRLPIVYGLAPRVHSREHGPAAPLILRLEDFWIDP